MTADPRSAPRVPRVLILVCDSFGVGGAPDADAYGDEGSDTLGNTAAAVGGIHAPNLGALGLGLLTRIQGVEPRAEVGSAHGRLSERSAGKDTTTGHWEMTGIVQTEPFPLYPNGFPPEIIGAFQEQIGREILGNVPASGTEIIARLGEEHLRTGKPIVYTSGDSVFQIAAHTDVVPLPTLYEWCRVARRLLTGRNNVGRVIARPFTGEPGAFVRRPERRDFSVPPPGPTLLDRCVDGGVAVYGVGKIQDIFAQQGLTEARYSDSNDHGVDLTIDFLRRPGPALVFANLVDFDSKYGHRNDPEGYAHAIEALDVRIPELVGALGGGVLLLTGDHGCDPTTPSTDHSRERTPLLAAGLELRRGDRAVNDPRDVVAAKRDGRTLEPDELRSFVLAYARGELPDYLAAAFLMAAFINGLDASETLALTRAMVDSGDTLLLGGISRPKVDKHSTGGVADGVTLVFAPIAASLGLAVAKLSGRGLGHTGGTLDKLESIPGLRTDLDPDAFERQVEEVGSAVAAQTADLVPADGALYALRDATATVPSVPLIAASVMSKKLAIGTDLVLLDVKAGSGAFMKTPDDAAELAEACAALAKDWGRPTRAAVTDMSQPLGEAIGNALDVVEAVRLLRGELHGRLRDVAVMFAGEAVSRLSDVPMGEGRARAAAAVDSGEALEAFRAMVRAQGGDPRVVDDPEGVLPAAPVVRPFAAERAGTLAAVDAEALGRASGELGAGRKKKGDPIDPAVGIVFLPKVGDRLEPGQELGRVHARSDDDAQTCIRSVLAAITLSDDPVEPPPLVYGWHG